MLFILLFILTVDGRAFVERNDDALCTVDLYTNEICSAVIIFENVCVNGLIDLTKSEYSNCFSSRFIWSHPANNLTLIIATPFSQQRQSYVIYFDNRMLKNVVSKVYRILDNQEKDITTQNQILMQESDENYQIIIKFQCLKHNISPELLIFYKIAPHF